MRPLELPPFSIKELLLRLDADSGMEALLALTTNLITGEVSYRNAGVRGSLWSLDAGAEDFSPEQRQLVHDSYVTRLRSKSSSGRDFYDYIRMTAPSGSCPNCLARDAAALDHYLPRAVYPQFALAAANLVPICTACNQVKSNKVASGLEDQFLHSYFDDLGSNWIGARVVETPGAPLVFRVVRPDRWTDVTHKRALKHFERFALGELYSVKAGSLLGNLRGSLEVRLRSAPPGGEAAAVADAVLERAEGYAQNHAIWEDAALKAWAASDWFCHGGWRTASDADVLAAAFARLRIDDTVDETDEDE